MSTHGIPGGWLPHVWLGLGGRSVSRGGSAIGVKVAIKFATHLRPGLGRLPGLGCWARRRRGMGCRSGLGMLVVMVVAVLAPGGAEGQKPGKSH